VKLVAVDYQCTQVFICPIADLLFLTFVTPTNRGIRRGPTKCLSHFQRRRSIATASRLLLVSRTAECYWHTYPAAADDTSALCRAMIDSYRSLGRSSLKRHLHLRRPGLCFPEQRAATNLWRPEHGTSYFCQRHIVGCNRARPCMGRLQFRAGTN